MNTQSINRKIFSAFSAVGAMALIVKLISLAKEMVLARVFGAGELIDAFLIAMIIPSLFVNVIGGSFGAALIPTYIRVREKEGDESADILFSSVIRASLVLMLIISLILYAFSPLFLRLAAWGFEAEQFELTLGLMRILIPLIVLSGLINIFSSVLNSHGKFAFAALVPGTVPVFALAALFLFHEKAGIAALAWGTLAGTLMNFILLLIALKKRNISLRLLPVKKGNGEFSTVIRQFWPMVGAGILTSGALVIDNSMASTLHTGAVSALGFGGRPVFFLISFVAGALGTAVIPFFAQMMARDESKELKGSFTRFFAFAFSISMIFLLLFYLFPNLIIRILYQGGQFSISDTLTVSRVLRFYSLMIPGYIVGMFCVRIVSSLRKNLYIFLISLFNLSFNVVLNLIFMKRMGVSGIALSTAFVYFFSTLLLLWVLNSKGQLLSWRVAASILVWLPGVLLLFALRPSGILWSGIGLIIVSIGSSYASLRVGGSDPVLFIKGGPNGSE